MDLKPERFRWPFALHMERPQVISSKTCVGTAKLLAGIIKLSKGELIGRERLSKNAEPVLKLTVRWLEE